jgi:hypothetical protein
MLNACVMAQYVPHIVLSFEACVLCWTLQDCASIAALLSQAAAQVNQQALHSTDTLRTQLTLSFCKAIQVKAPAFLAASLLHSLWVLP